MGDFESGVEVIARLGDRRVEVPIKDEEIYPETAGLGELLFDSAGVVVLPAGKRLAVLIGPIGHALEVEVRERSGPAVEIVGAEAGTGLR